MIKENRDAGDEKAAKTIQKELTKLEDKRGSYLQSQISVLDELPQFRDLLEVMLDRIDVVKAEDNYGNSFVKKLSTEVTFNENGDPVVSPYKIILDRIKEKIQSSLTYL